MVAYVHPKSEVVLLPFDAPGAFTFEGPWRADPAGTLAILEKGTRVRCVLPRVSFVAALCTRHDWSGSILATCNGTPAYAVDLHSHVPYQDVIEIAEFPEPASVKLELVSIGKSPISRSAELVFHGLILKADEARRLPFASHCKRLVREEHTHESFEEVQTKMTDRFNEKIAQTGTPPEEFQQRVIRTYSFRVREALTFARRGARVLDIGAGFIFEEIIREVMEPLAIDYYTHDLDGRAVQHAKEVFARLGVDPLHATQGENTVLPVDSNQFDLVFSSHCLEHSSDLEATFSEIHRVLKPGGMLVFSVPLGVDDSNEHIYCISRDQWFRLTADSGFEPLCFHIGKIYTGEGAWDFTLAARKA